MYVLTNAVIRGGPRFWTLPIIFSNTFFIYNMDPVDILGKNNLDPLTFLWNSLDFELLTNCLKFSINLSLANYS